MSSTAVAEVAPQHLQALEAANRVRLARASLKRRVASQELSAAEVIAEFSSDVGGMAVGDLLLSQRRWGRARCQRVLLALGLSEHKEIGRLTERQRRALLALLDG